MRYLSRLILLLKERRRIKALKRELRAWEAKNVTCRHCDGLGEVELFVDFAHTVLDWTQCRMCKGTGVRPDSPKKYPDHLREVI